MGRAATRALMTAGATVSWVSSPTSSATMAGVDSIADFWRMPVPKREDVLAHFDAVIYAASRTTPSYAGNTIGFECEENLKPLGMVLDSLSVFGTGRLVYISSAGAIYAPSPAPLSEESPKRATSLYGAGKLAAESFLNTWSLARPGTVSILRPSNVYGPGQELRSGFGLVRTVLERLARDQEIQVFREGKDRRDYLFVDDFAAAMLAALAGPAGTYLVAAGESHTALDVIRLAEEVTGKRAKLAMLKDTRSPASDVLIAIDQIKHSLDWQPHVDLREGIERTWRWLRDNKQHRHSRAAGNVD